MRALLPVSAFFGLLLGTSAASIPAVKPFTVNLSSRVPHMLDLIGRTTLPAAELAAAHASSNISLTTGMSLDTLKSLQNEWITSFNWTREEEQMNTYEHRQPKSMK